MINNDEYNINIYNKVFNEDINDNYDLIPLLMTIKQKELLHYNNKNPNILNRLNVLNKGYGIFSKLSENYFETSKYTDSNPVLSDINNLLKDIFRLTLGNSIELLIRKILLEYFLKTTNADLNIINNNIETILTNTEIYGESMIDLLYNDLCDKLIKNSTQIFKNNNEQVTYISKNTIDIFNEFFEKLKHNTYLSEDIIIIFKNEVTSYLSSIVPQTIKYWLINMENIMRFFINNYRCLETLKELTN
jgi:hypothetical protein